MLNILNYVTLTLLTTILLPSVGLADLENKKVRCEDKQNSFWVGDFDVPSDIWDSGSELFVCELKTSFEKAKKDLSSNITDTAAAFAKKAAIKALDGYTGGAVSILLGVNNRSGPSELDRALKRLEELFETQYKLTIKDKRESLFAKYSTHIIGNHKVNYAELLELDQNNLSRQERDKLSIYISNYRSWNNDVAEIISADLYHRDDSYKYAKGYLLVASFAATIWKELDYAQSRYLGEEFTYFENIETSILPTLDAMKKSHDEAFEKRWESVGYDYYHKYENRHDRIAYLKQHGIYSYAFHMHDQYGIYLNQDQEGISADYRVGYIKDEKFHRCYVGSSLDKGAIKAWEDQCILNRKLAKQASYRQSIAQNFSSDFFNIYFNLQVAAGLVKIDSPEEKKAKLIEIIVEKGLSRGVAQRILQEGLSFQECLDLFGGYTGKSLFQNINLIVTKSWTLFKRKPTDQELFSMLMAQFRQGKSATEVVKYQYAIVPTVVIIVNSLLNM